MRTASLNNGGMPRRTHVCFREKKNWVAFALETSPPAAECAMGGEGLSHLAHRHLFVGSEHRKCYGEHNRKGIKRLFWG